MWKQLLLVSLGGALGTLLRFSTTILWPDKVNEFPYATFLVNIIGSFLIGVLFVITEKIPIEYRFGLSVGFCGGLTTFSAFSWQTLRLLMSGQIVLASTYVFVSVSISLVMVYLGYYLTIRNFHG